jgi:hypothetical protein
VSSADDEQDPDFLPSARRAMRLAVEAASDGDFDRSYLWIAIAHELRIGASPAKPFPIPRPLEREVEPEPGQIPVPAERPTRATVTAPDETAIIRYEPYGNGEAGTVRCGNCGHGIELVFPDTDNAPPIWRHLITKQQVCPVSAPDQTHTFAEPLLDQRG